MDRELTTYGVLLDNDVPVWVSAASQSNLIGSYAPLKAATDVKSPSMLSCLRLRESNMRFGFRDFGLIYTVVNQVRRVNKTKSAV